MKVGLGRIVQATNTFAKLPTDFTEFERDELLVGQDVERRYRATSTAIGGALSTCDAQRLEVVPLIAASALSGGTMTAECFDRLVELLEEQLAPIAPELDAILLELHGAAVAESEPSVDEAILRRIREIAGTIPLVAVLSQQANLTQGIIDHTDMVIGQQAFPSIDAAKRGAQAIDLLGKLAREELKPASSLEWMPFLIPLVSQCTGSHPMCRIASQAQQLCEQGGVVDVSVFGGFPFSDVTHAGASVVVTGASGASQPDRVAKELATSIWEKRSEFSVDARNVEEAIHDAMASRDGPVVLADLGDVPDCGGPGDGTTLLWALLDLGTRDAVLASIADARAVESCVNAGIGSRVEIPIGGLRDTRHGYPIDVRGKVKTITDGRFALDGPIGQGLRANAGRTVVLETEARHDGIVDVILTEKRIEAADLGLFRHVGIDPSDRHIIALKSAVQYRASFEPIASRICNVITPGITTPDPHFFEYRHVSRPIFPLDPM